MGWKERKEGRDTIPGQQWYLFTFYLRKDGAGLMDDIRNWNPSVVSGCVFFFSGLRFLFTYVMDNI